MQVEHTIGVHHDLSSVLVFLSCTLLPLPFPLLFLPMYAHPSRCRSDAAAVDVAEVVRGIPDRVVGIAAGAAHCIVLLADGRVMGYV